MKKTPTRSCDNTTPPWILQGIKGPSKRKKKRKSCHQRPEAEYNLNKSLLEHPKLNKNSSGHPKAE